MSSVGDTTVLTPVKSQRSIFAPPRPLRFVLLSTNSNANEGVQTGDTVGVGWRGKVLSNEPIRHTSVRVLCDKVTLCEPDHVVLL